MSKTLNKTTPFTYVNELLKNKNHDGDFVNFVPYIINKTLSNNVKTFEISFIANIYQQYMSPEQLYDFYKGSLNGIAPKFIKFPTKPIEVKSIIAVQSFFSINEIAAIKLVETLKPSIINQIEQWYELIQKNKK